MAEIMTAAECRAAALLGGDSLLTSKEQELYEILVQDNDSRAKVLRGERGVLLAVELPSKDEVQNWGRWASEEALRDFIARVADALAAKRIGTPYRGHGTGRVERNEILLFVPFEGLTAERARKIRATWDAVTDSFDQKPLAGLVRRVSLSTDLDHFTQVVKQCLPNRYGNIVKDVKVEANYADECAPALNVKILFREPLDDADLPQELVAFEADFEGEDDDEGVVECSLTGTALCQVLSKVFGEKIAVTRVDEDIVYFLSDGTIVE